MRLLILLSLVLQTAVHAQPSFCFVLAEDEEALRPYAQGATVVQHYRERIPYVGIVGSYLGAPQELPLQGGPLFRDSTQQWLVYGPVEGMAESYVLVIHGTDTLRIELPENAQPLIERAWRRGDRDTPEVVRFRKGPYAIEHLIAEPWADSAANTLARQLLAEDEVAYREELAKLEQYYRELPPPVPPPVPYTPPPPMTPAAWAAYMAEQPPLKEARVERVSADTVWVRFTGRVQLNGGCASGMPSFGVEMRTDAGWVERLAFDPVQMDCGMPWADWTDHIVMMPPLRWWVGARSPAATKELVPGSYRLLFVGGNGKEVRTAAFEVE